MSGSRLALFTAVGLYLLAALPAWAGAPDGHGFLHRVFKDGDGREARYVLFVPQRYRGDRPWPLILFLHGAGETGTDGDKQVQVGLGPFVRKHQKTFPFIVVFPQSEHRTWQAHSADADRALRILDRVENEYRVDRRRVYLTGLSMGGFGTWSLAAAYPDRWSAIVPICGGGNPATAARIKDTPCWCFHGGSDLVVQVTRSRAMVDALRRDGGQPRYTEFPHVGHNSWDRAYATPGLFDWLLSQHRAE